MTGSATQRERRLGQVNDRAPLAVDYLVAIEDFADGL
jgi:hypothetical protein